jgi:ankyrin repeat protein
MTLGIPGIKITMSSVDQHEAMDSGMTLLQKLCENLHDCAWESLLSRLIPLQDTPSLIVPSTAVADVAYGSTVLHTIVWKAPKILANTFIELVPKNLEADKLFQMTDEDENTALHLCCSNLGPFHYPSSDRSETSVCDIGLSTLELLLNRSPNALTMQNKEGDTPLHLFVSCPAVTDIPPINSYFQRTESIQASLEAFSLIFDRLPNMEAAILKDITGATPLHTAIASSAENTFLMTLLNAAPFACKVEDLDGMIPLHYAASTPTISAEFMKELIRSYRFGLCHKTKNGDTPLHLAVRNLGSSDIDHDIPSSCPNTINLLKALMGHFLDDDNLPLTQISRGDLNKRYCPLLIMNQEKVIPAYIHIPLP